MKKIEEVVKKLRRPEVFAQLLLGYELAPKQIELLKLTTPTQIICAGRRFGKSTLVATRALHFALLRPESKIIVAGPSLDQAKIYFDILAGSLEKSPLKVFVKGTKLSPFPTLVLKNGSEIAIRSTAQEGRFLRGRKVHMVILTEAAFVKDSVYHKVILPMRLDTRATIILESTPSGHNYFFDEFQRGREDPKIGIFHATVYDNPAIAKEDIEDAKKRVPDYVWRQEYLAEFIEDDTVFFKWSIIAEAFDDYAPTGYIEGHRYSMGVDLAKYRNYTVVVVLDVSEEPYKIAEFHRFNQVPYEKTIKLINELQAKYRCTVNLDATGVGEPVSERVNACRPFVFSTASKSELLHNLLLAFEQRKFLLPASNAVLRDELRYFRRVQAGQHLRLEAPEGYHDDCVIALALAVWGAKTSMVQVLDKSDWGVW